MKFSLKQLFWFVVFAAIVCAGIGFAIDSQLKARRDGEIERARLWKAATASVRQRETVYGKPIIETYQAKCVRVIDGDTLVVLRGKTQIKIRLDSIDSPELDQPFGKKAKQRLSEWVFGIAGKVAAPVHRIVRRLSGQ